MLFNVCRADHFISYLNIIQAKINKSNKIQRKFQKTNKKKKKRHISSTNNQRYLAFSFHNVEKNYSEILNR